MKKGFTMVELLIVVLIIGIVAAIAFPQFSKSKEHAIGKEAIANLKLIAAAQKIYRMEWGAYYPATGPTSVSDIATINSFLKLYMPSGTSKNWNYTVNSATTTSTATRASGSGCVYTMNFATAEDPTAGAGCP